MALGKWFAGAIGWMVGGPLGALLGFVLASMMEEQGGTSSASRPRSSENAARAARDNFLFSLLVLSSCVIKADGRVMHSEMEYVRAFLRRTFGEDAVEQGERILLQLFRQPIDVGACGEQMAQHLDLSARLQLLHYLSGIAAADGHVTDDEVRVLREIALALHLEQGEVDRMLALGGDSLEEAYKVLGVEKEASNEELRRAYKKLVLQNHPDRVASLGEDIRRNAEEKLKKINDAYGKVRNARGL